jgi:hypothetical protein
LSVPLDYRPPGEDRRRTVTATGWAFIATAVEHAFVFLFYAATLDGGYLAKDCFIVSVAFWVLMAVVRRRTFGVTDRLFIALGYPAMLIPCLYARGHL